MLLADYRPHPKLVTPETRITRPRYPVIDVHNHLGGDFGGGGEKRPVSELLDDMDAVDVRVYVDLDGGWGEDILECHLDTIKARAPERFMVFGGVDWSQWPAHGSHFGEWAAGRLRAQVNRGAQGLKIWKPLGLSVRDDQGQLVCVDDERLDPIWQTASELHIPVLIHVADPVAFFDPIDGTNERWEELGGHPDWAFTSPPGPTFLSIVEGLAAVVARHPGTTFIGAHVGCYAENLGWVSALMERCPNFYVDISARIAELGRQPFAARRFFLKHAERILFGLDAGVNHDFYRITFRFLESEDEYFPYGPGDLPGQGRWNIYGLHLPAKVLQQVYHTNAMQVLGLAQLP